MEELQKLYDVLVREGKYSKSFDEFKSKWSKDAAYKNKVYDVAVRDGLYSKTKDEFFQKYSTANLATEPVQKKKFASESSLGVGSSGSQESPKKSSGKMRSINDVSEEELKNWSSILQKSPEEKPQIDKALKATFNKINNKVGSDKRISQTLGKINSNLIGKEEEEVVSQLSKDQTLKDLGFTFEESGALGDYVTVTAPDGKTTTEISLDNFLGSKSAKQALALQKFIKDNISKEKRIELDKIVLKEEFENKQLQDKKKKLGDIFDKQLGTKPKVEDSAYLKERLASIDTDLINETEENVVAEMEYQFGDLGFKFEKTGMLGDYMKVIAPNGKETEISLDNFLDSKSTKQADLLKGFIKTNTPAKGLFVLERTQKEEDKKFNSQKQVDESIKSFSKDLNDLNLRQKQFLAKKAQLDKQIKENGLTQELQNQGIALNEEMKTLLDEEENIKYKQRKLDAAVGKYTIMESKKGTTAGAFLNEFLLGVGDMLSGITNLATDIYVERTPTEKLLLEKDLKEETVRLSKKLGLKPPTENQSISEWKKTLTEDQIDEWEDEIDDYAKKDFKKEMLPLLRIGGKEVFGDRETTQQFADLKKEGFWGGAILGLARSLPAMAGGPGVAGAVQRTAQMYAQVSDGLAQEMENNPEFANISENEKLAITLPIGIVGAVLENVGLRNIKGSQGLINNITLRVLGKTGKGVTAKTFRELVENEVDSAITRGALTITAAGTAEFETGAAQELSNIGFKEIYNEIKGKEMFDTPDSIEDLVENVVVSGLQEGVGGFVLGVPTAVSAAYSKKGFLKMDDDSFKAFESMANDENIQTAYVTNLKNQITRGIITMSEAKTQLNDYRNAAGLYRQLPEGLNTQQKKEAMNLLKEKRDLENYVQGKDNALVVKQKERITEIDNSLTKLSETDAVQEQSTTEVPVQSETITSETLETGVPESGPEVITEQTTQEEVVEEPRIKDSQIPLKRETFEVELDNGATTNIEVTTNKDGSRQIVTKVDGFVSEGDNINKDNTLTTEEYIAKAYGEIKGEPKVEQGNDIMAPAMKEKLTPKQKAELGIEVITEQAEPQTIIEDQATEDIVKVKKSPDFMNDAEHIVTLNDEEAGRMYYDRSSKAWRDPNFDKSKYSFESFERIYGDILGETKQEATDELIRRRKESMKQEAPIEETVAEETVAEEPQGVQFSKDTILNKFLNKLNSLNPLQKNPIDNKSFIYGDKASLEFNRFDKGDKNEVSLEGISSLDKGRGLGKEAMTDITKSADELGTTLTLDAKPFGREGLGKKELIDFYKKNGFEVDQQYLEDLDFASEQEAIDYVLENESEALPMIRKPQPQVVSEQVETVPVIEEVNELLELDTKDQTSLQRVLDYLDRADSALDLDPNELNDVTRVMATATAKAVIKSLKALVSAGITLQEAIKRVSTEQNVTPNQIIEAMYVASKIKEKEISKKINASKGKLKNAKKNIVTKLGVADGLVVPLQQLFNINPKLIPSQYLDRYLELVNMFGERRQVLSLEEKSVVIKDVNEILDEIDNETSKADELAYRFELSDNKVFNEDDTLNYAESIKKMFKEGEIDSDELDLMTKYKKQIAPQVEKEKRTEQEIREEKEYLIKEIKSSTINSDGLVLRDERNSAKKIAELIKGKAIEALSNVELKNLIKVIDNINNGYLPHYAQLIKEKLNAQPKASLFRNAINRAKALPISKLYSKFKSKLTGKDSVLELVRRNPLYYIDQVFGDFKTRDLFDSILRDSAEGEAKYSSDLKKIQDKLDKALTKVSSSFNKNGNKVVMSKYKMMTYMLQLEYESNEGNKEVNPASEYLKATIKKIATLKSKFNERDSKILQEILKEYSTDGEIDNKKLYDSFNSAEKDAIKTIREVNESLTEKAVYTSAVIRGQRINPLTNYIHLNVINDNGKVDEEASLMNNFNDSRKPSTKAKSLIERTRGAKAIDFDIFSSANRGAKGVLLDYYLTEPIRTARKTINTAIYQLESEGPISKEKRQIINAIEGAFEESVSNMLETSYKSTSLGNQVVDFVSKQGYRTVLAGTGRFVSEFISNAGFVLNSDPTTFAEGLKYMGTMMSSKGPSVMNNVSSTETNRIYPSDQLSGRLIDGNILSQTSGERGNTSSNPVFNKARQIWNLTGKRFVKNPVELSSDFLISTPDKAIMRPVWFGAFASQFKKETGRDVDFNLIAENDETYMNDNKDAIEKSKIKADERSIITGASKNAFTGMLKGTNKVTNTVTERVFNNFNNFMSTFLIYEFITARTGIVSAMGNGSLTRKQGVALLAGVVTRMTVYSLMTKALGAGLVGLVAGGDDEEEEKKSLDKAVGQALASTFTSLLFGRDFGNATKTIINLGIENFNENYLQGLREGEYDPYEDAIQFSPIPPEKEGKERNISDFIVGLSGSYQPMVKTLDLAVKKGLSKDKKTEEAQERLDKEKYVRLPLEILGNLGLVPLYKEVRKTVMEDMYKGIKKDKKDKELKAGEVADRKEESRSQKERALKEVMDRNPSNAVKEAAKDLLEDLNVESEEDKKLLKEERDIEKEKKKALLVDPKTGTTYDNETELKRYNPILWRKNFGPYSEWYKEHNAENLAKKAMNKEIRKEEDKEYRYIRKSKTKKNNDGSSKRTYSYKRSQSTDGASTSTYNYSSTNSDGSFKKRRSKTKRN